MNNSYSGNMLVYRNKDDGVHPIFTYYISANIFLHNKEVLWLIYLVS